MEVVAKDKILMAELGERAVLVEVQPGVLLAARAAEAVMVDLHTLLQPAAMEGLAVLEGIVTAVVAVEAEMGVWGEPG